MTTTTPRMALVLAALTAAPGCTSPRAGASAHQAAIYWGEPENGYDGVVRLTISFSLLAGAQCSGTLVSPRVVVTAQHCTVDDQGAPVEPSAILVETGPAGTRGQYAVEEVRTPDGQSLSGADIAVLITRDPVPEPPYPYAVDFQGRPGDPMTLVGYGQREDGSSGHKSLGDNVVGYVFDTYFTTTGEPGCHGDSGGPAFDADGVLVGVIVNTLGGWVGQDTCLSGVSGLTRVDAFHDLVDGAVDDAWLCDGADAETCDDGRDNDCNHLVDEGCLALGAACADAASCASGDCRAVGGDARCTSSCTVGGVGECPEGFYCDELACGQGACAAGVAGGGVLGDACAADTDCANLSCLDAGDDDDRRCLRPCADDSGCTEGEVCAGADVAGCGGCVPTADGAPFDAPCAAGPDCASGLCVEDAFGAMCSTPCAPACPAGFVCDPEQHCVRAPRGDAPLGSPCDAPESCASGACEVVGETAVCSAACDEAGACPPGFTCAPGPSGPRCEPAASVVGQSCTADEDCLSGLCGNFDAYRACTQACTEDAPCPDGLVCMAGAGGGYCRPRTPPPPPLVEDDDGGCGCRLAPGLGGGPTDGKGALLLLFLAVLPVARRRS